MGTCDLYQGDCLDVMKDIPDNSIDMVLTDPPYGTTTCKWDNVIPFQPMWEQIWRITKPNVSIVLFGQEPFSSMLRVSSIQNFKYDLYWRKSRPSGFTNAKLKPLKDVEVISIFSKGSTANGSKKNMPYFPQGLVEVNKDWQRPRVYMGGDRGVNPSRVNSKKDRIIKFENYPRQVLDYANSNKGLYHPTQKPLPLMEYLIKTYTNKGETVLDFTMGSGTTGVACKNLVRSFIGIELDVSYFNIAKGRINGTPTHKQTT